MRYPAAMSAATRLSSPAALRNREPLLEALSPWLKRGDRVLEIASGSGEHATFLAPRLECKWTPSDPSPEARESIAAWTQELDVGQWVQAPEALDASAGPWPKAPVDAVVCINMIHIAPIEALDGLIDGCRQVLEPGGHLILYGPFKERGVRIAESNQAFDESLRARDPRWGIRALGDVEARAERASLTRRKRIEMPANNLTVVFQRQPGH